MIDIDRAIAIGNKYINQGIRIGFICGLVMGFLLGIVMVLRWPS